MNPLMQSMGQVQPNNGTAPLGNIFRMLKSGNSEQIAMSLMQRNPQFRAFMDANRGKSPEQVAKHYGVDLNAVMGQFK